MSITDDYAVNSYVMNSFGKIISDSTTSVEEFVQRTMLSDPEVRNTMIKTVFDQASRRITAKSRITKYHSKIQLSSREQTIIQEAYYDLDVDFTTAHETPPHAFAHLSRMLAYPTCYRVLGILGKLKSVGYDILVKDFGASGLYHVMHKDTNVHSCVGNFDINDSIRISALHHSLANPDTDYYTPDRAELIQKYKSNDSDIICYNGIDKCNITAPYAIMIDSIYDITFDVLLEALVRSKTQVLAGCFVYDSSILVSDYGVVPNLNMRYVKYNSCGEIYIKFFFENDYGTVYRHRWIDYIRLLTTFVLSKDGNHYSYQLVEHRCGLMYFKIMKLLTISPQCTADRVLTINAPEEMVVLYTWNYDTIGKFLGENMTPKRIVVSTVLVELIKSFGYSLTDGRRTVSNLLIAANSFNNRKIINGKEIHAIKQLSSDDLYSVVIAVYIHLYITNWEQTKCLAKILQNENTVREFGSKLKIFSRLSHIICDKVFRKLNDQHNYDLLHPSLSDTTDILIHRENQSKSYSFVERILSYVGKCLKVDRKYPITFQNMCRFYSITEELEMLLSARPITGLKDMYHTENSSFNDIDRQVLELALLSNYPKDSTAYDFTSFAISVCTDSISLHAQTTIDDCVYYALRTAGVTTLSPLEIKAIISRSPFLDYVKNKDILLNSLKAPPLEVFIVIASHFDICVCIHTRGKCHRFGKGRVYHFREHQNHIDAYVSCDNFPQIIIAADYHTLPAGTFDISKQRDDLNHNDAIRFGSIKAILYDLNVNCEAEVVNADVTHQLNDVYFNLYRTFFPQNVVRSGGFVCRSAIKSKEILERFNNCATSNCAITIGAPGGEAHELINRGFSRIYGITLAGAIPWARDVLEHPTFTDIYGPHCDGNITDYTFRRYLYCRFAREKIDFIGCDASSGINGADILRSEAEICIQLASEDTLCYLKVNDFDHYVVSVLHTLSCYFREVKCVRLSATKPFSREHHIIMTGRCKVNYADDYNVWYCRYSDFMRKVLDERDKNFCDFSIALRSVKVNYRDTFTADNHIMRKFLNSGCKMSRANADVYPAPIVPVYVLDTFGHFPAINFIIDHYNACVISTPVTIAAAQSSRINTYRDAIPSIPNHESTYTYGKVLVVTTPVTSTHYPILVHDNYERCLQFILDYDLPFKIDKDEQFETRSHECQEYLFIYKDLSVVLKSQELPRSLSIKTFKTTYDWSPSFLIKQNTDVIVNNGYTLYIHDAHSKKKVIRSVTSALAPPPNTPATPELPDDPTDEVLTTFRMLFSQLTNAGLTNTTIPENYSILFENGTMTNDHKDFEALLYFDVLSRSVNNITHTHSLINAYFDIATNDASICRGALIHGKVRIEDRIVTKLVSADSSFVYDCNSLVIIPPETSFPVIRYDVQYELSVDGRTGVTSYKHVTKDMCHVSLSDFVVASKVGKVYIICCTRSRDLVKNYLSTLLSELPLYISVCIISDYEVSGLTDDLPVDVSSSNCGVSESCLEHPLINATYWCDYCKVTAFCSMICCKSSDHYTKCSVDQNTVIASRTDNAYVYLCDSKKFLDNIHRKVVLCVFDNAANPRYNRNLLLSIDNTIPFDVPDNHLHLHIYPSYYILMVNGFENGVFSAALLLKNLQEFFDIKPRLKNCTLYLSKNLNPSVDQTTLRIMDLPCSVAVDDDRVKTYLPSPYVRRNTIITDAQKRSMVAAAKEAMVYCDNSSIAMTRDAKTIYDACLLRDVKYIIANNVNKWKFAILDKEGEKIVCNYPGYVRPMKVYTANGVMDLKSAKDNHLLEFKYDSQKIMGFLAIPQFKVAFEYILPTILKDVGVYTDYTYQVVQAAPGCGKSTNVINVIQPNDIALVYTTAGCLDLTTRLRSRIQSKKPMVYTVASILINQPSLIVETLWVDEARMNNPGLLFYAISILKPKHVVFLGDGLQIPFVNTISSMNMQYYDLYSILPITDLWNVSYRITTTVCSLLQPFYADYCKNIVGYSPLTTTNTVNGECELIKINQISQVEYNADAVYLTFTQEEKLKLADHFADKLTVGKNLFTVHEFQGNQCKHVVAFRSNLYKDTIIFQQEAYGIVMLSRHTHSFKYYTFLSPKEGGDFVVEMLSKLAATDMRVKTNELNKYQFKTLRGLTDFSVDVTSYYTRTPVDYRDYKTASKKDIANAILYITSEYKHNTARVFSLRRDEDSYFSLRDLTLIFQTMSSLSGLVVFDLCDKYTPSYLYTLIYKSFPNCTIRVSAKSANSFSLAPYQVYNALIMNGIFDKPVFETVTEAIRDVEIPNTMERISISRVPFDRLYGNVFMYKYSAKFVDYVAKRSRTNMSRVSEILTNYHSYKSTDISLIIHTFDWSRFMSVLLETKFCYITNCQTLSENEYNTIYQFCVHNNCTVHFTDYFDFSDGRDAPIAEIQDVLHEFYGFQNCVNNDYDTYYVNTQDININCGQPITMNPIKGVYTYKPDNTLRSKIHSPVSSARPHTSVEALLAFAKRNCAVPELGGVIDSDAMANVLYKNLMLCLEDGAFVDQRNEVGACSYLISEWLKTQKFNLDQLVGEMPLELMDVSAFEFGIKGSVKVNVEYTSTKTYSSLQTILFHRKNINAIFCQIWGFIRKYFLKHTKHNFQMFCDLNMDEFSTVLTNRDTELQYFDTCERIDIDISMYDKSQSLSCLKLECKILELFGVDRRFINIWFNAHFITSIRDTITGLKSVVYTQRKSGDSATFIGNTIFLMAVMTTIIPHRYIRFSLFSGDDSVIWFDVPYNIPHASFAVMFNLTTKLTKYDCTYFCSKFIIRSGLSLVCIPDPMKFFVKLGRKDLVSYTHLEEYRRSLYDLLKNYSDYDLCTRVAHAVSCKYGITINISSLLHRIPSMLSPRVFNQFFYVPAGVVLDESKQYSKVN